MIIFTTSTINGVFRERKSYAMTARLVVPDRSVVIARLVSSRAAIIIVMGMKGASGARKVVAARLYSRFNRYRICTPSSIRQLAFSTRKRAKCLLDEQTRRQPLESRGGSSRNARYEGENRPFLPPSPSPFAHRLAFRRGRFHSRSTVSLVGRKRN